ncbi:hypothetical protein D9M68_814610 [compost metagenome]
MVVRTGRAVCDQTTLMQQQQYMAVTVAYGQPVIGRLLCFTDDVFPAFGYKIICQLVLLQVTYFFILTAEDRQSVMAHNLPNNQDHHKPHDSPQKECTEGACKKFKNSSQYFSP